jgi:RNA polymerase sigma-70 factor, ECF subfamily
MPGPVPSPSPDSADSALAARIAQSDHAAFESLMRTHNARLFRVARAITKDDGDAEDVLQDAYLDAYRHIGDFRGQAQLATWLTRIVINHALGRLRKLKRERVVVPFPDANRSGEPTMQTDVPDETSESPAAAATRGEVRQLLERRIDELPVAFRTVFVLREVQELSVDETAECLGIPPATVRTRLFRARALLRESLARDLDVAARDVFAFAGARCDRIVANVLAQIATI